MARILLKKGRASPLWHGHPWVYSGSVLREETYAPGDVVEVCDHEGRLIGRGFANPRSQVRVRLVTWRDETVDAELIARRLDEAARLRRRLHLPSDDTDAFRLVNSEGDGLPGLVVDLYGDVAAVQFTALGMKRLDAVVFDALMARGLRGVVEVAAGSFAQIEGFASATRTVRGEAPEQIPCKENGIRLEVDPLHGQKTGMFLDQRESRRRVRELARGARVLDMYTYAGGFALNALAGGATSVDCVDASARALERARHHAELNKLPGTLEFHEADAFRFLEQARPQSYDLVILDPPKFARAKKDLGPALKGYERLNSLAINACAPDAMLLTCSCSQNVDEQQFERVIAGAAQSAGRRIQVVDRWSQGGDHPLPPTFDEGRYLKVALCRVL